MTLLDATATGGSSSTPLHGVGTWPAPVDWENHPLGGTEGWPPALRTAVDICLGSRFPMLVWWGRDLTMLYNDAYRPMLGAKHPDALGAPGRQVWPEIWDVIGPMLDQVMNGGGATWSTDQLLVLDRNGFPEECYFTYSYSPIPDESGAVAGVFCAVSETTDRVVGERRLATLAEMAHLLGVERRRDVLETAEALLGDNPKDHPVALVVDGAGDDEPATALAGRLDDLPEATRAQVADLVRDAVTTGRPVRMPADAAALAAGIRTWHVHPVPVSGAAQAPGPAALLVLGESVQRPWDPSLEAYATLCGTHLAAALTAVADLSQERAQRQALLELDEAKSAFLTNVSHELRTPLTLIAAPVQELLASASDPEDRARLELVHRSTARLVRMVDALLDFGRMEAGGLVPHPTPVDVTELTRGLAESFRPAVERAGLSFTHECLELGGPAWLDVDMYERIVLNLLSNAVKYTPEGSVHLTLGERDGHLQVSVRDTGVGIAEADVERAFARFERLSSWDGVRSREGAGIGLAMVEQLTALMGGTVELASEVGIGSTFTVRLPHRNRTAAPAVDSAPSITPRRVDDFLRETRLWEDDPEDQDRTGSSRVADAGSSTVRLRVLVAEDNVDLRRYLGQVLGDLYDVELVDNGGAALDAALRDAPDLVLADVMMPTLDGFQLVERIREDPLLRGIPVVLLSARAGAAETSSGLVAGADDYLVKPFSVVELRARVASNIERAGARLQDSSWRRAVLDSLHDALVITDRDGTVLEVNDRFTTMLGWTADDGPFTPPYPWQPSEDGPGPSPADVRALATREGAEPVEGRLVSKDGRVLHVSARVTVVDGGRRRPDLFLWTLRDETHEHEERRRRSTAARLAAELGRAEELTDVLVAAVAGFSQLFEGAAAVRVVVGAHQHVFTPTGPLQPSALEEKVVAALGEADARATGDQRVPGVLLVAGAGAPECMVWVDFGEARRVGADEQITGDLLVEAFALACDRVVAATDFADRERHLRRAIESHQEIGQAVGILVERHRWTSTVAFDRLKRASQDHNIRLRELAHRVIVSGADPGQAGSDLAARR